MTFTPFEILTALCVIAMLVMNLRVGMSVNALTAKFERDLARVELQVANLRTEIAKDQAALLQQLMKTITQGFVNRNESQAMHDANTKRLDGIDEDIKALAQRVADIA